MKKLKSKSSWHCPFKHSLHTLGYKNKDFLHHQSLSGCVTYDLGEKLIFVTWLAFDVFGKNRVKRLLSMRLVFQARTQHALNAFKRMLMLSMLFMMSSAG
jgi:hypothetical protein